MGDVIRLPEHREAASEGTLVYSCQRCGSRQFLLQASGVAYCADCNALMRNLVVVKAP